MRGDAWARRLFVRKSLTAVATAASSFALVSAAVARSFSWVALRSACNAHTSPMDVPTVPSTEERGPGPDSLPPVLCFAARISADDIRPTAGRLGPADRSGSATRPRRSRWPSRSPRAGPSPRPSTRASRALRGQSDPGAGRQPCDSPRRSSASHRANSAACSAWGGSCSRMIRRISSKAAWRNVSWSKGVVPVKSSYSSTPRL